MNENQSTLNKVHEHVSREYSHKIKAAEIGVGESINELPPGYESEALDRLDQNVRESSFGCGNPLAFSEIQQGQTVVDLGSGAGLDLILAAERVGPNGKAIGIDMTDAMIESARKNIEKNGIINAEIKKGFIENLPLESGSVDWVLSNCVVNLSPDKPRVFREIARVLKPGGQMLISDIVVNALPDWIRLIGARIDPSMAGVLGEEDYRSALVEAGLHSVEIRDRFIYERQELQELIQYELFGEMQSSSFKRKIQNWLLQIPVARVAGRVASIRVYAKKINAGAA